MQGIVRTLTLQAFEQKGGMIKRVPLAVVWRINKGSTVEARNQLGGCCSHPAEKCRGPRSGWDSG